MAKHCMNIFYDNWACAHGLNWTSWWSDLRESGTFCQLGPGMPNSVTRKGLFDMYGFWKKDSYFLHVYSVLRSIFGVPKGDDLHMQVVFQKRHYSVSKMRFADVWQADRILPIFVDQATNIVLFLVSLWVFSVLRISYPYYWIISHVYF